MSWSWMTLMKCSNHPKMYSIGYCTSEIDKPYLKKSAALLGKQRVISSGISLVLVRDQQWKRLILILFFKHPWSIAKVTYNNILEYFYSFPVSPAPAPVKWNFMCIYYFHESTFHIALSIVIQPCFLAGEGTVTIFSCCRTVSLWLGDEAKSKARPGCSACIAFKVKNWLYSHVE